MSIGGSMAASKAYYDSHPAAKAKKNAYQKKYMQTETAKRIRRNADKHRDKGSVGDGMDYSHHDGKLVAAGKHRSADKKRKPNKSNIDKVVGHMSLQDIKDMLLDDDTLTNEERMDLYYEEHLRVQKEKEEKRLVRGAKPLDEIMKDLGLTFSDGSQTSPKKKK